MSITMKDIKAFWNLPEGKQFISACFIVIGALCTVIGIQYFELGRGARREQTLERKIGEVKKECGDEKLMMQRQCDSEKTAMRNNEISELKARLLEMKLKEEQMDEAIRNAHQVMAVQARAHRNVRRSIQEVQNATQ